MGRCAISGYDVDGALIAAHIKPFKKSQEQELENGLLLRADLHMLFDTGLITVCGSDGTTPSANCSIVVHYKSGPSRAKGLIPKVASSLGRASWPWRVGSNTTPGRWPIVMTCEKGTDHGELKTSLDPHPRTRMIAARSPDV
jgi:hypothetical protein